MKLNDADNALEGLEYIRAFLTGLDPRNHWPHKPNLERVVANCLKSLDTAEGLIAAAYEATQDTKK